MQSNAHQSVYDISEIDFTIITFEATWKSDIDQ